MFAKDVYMKRRTRLRDQVGSGMILFLGNDESPMNYRDNPYPFRQDASFLYFFGLDSPGLAAVIDIDGGTECLFGDDLTVDEIVWTGPQPTLKEKCQLVGVPDDAPRSRLPAVMKKATDQGRTIHFLPQYRPENLLRIEQLLAIHPTVVHEHVSEPLIRAVVAQRSSKSAEEIGQIEAALEISYEMQTTAMRMARPGRYEREVAGAMEGMALAQGGRLAFATIFSVHGETLHNPFYSNMMREGDIAVNDSGAESAFHYASDITRTIPVGGKFSQRQKEIYGIVLSAQAKATGAVKPGVEFRQVHQLACEVLASGLKDLGLMKGDTSEAIHAGAHTLFFQCGVGHMLGLDVHDMEALGEDYVGYTDTIRRSQEFGTRSLRLARELQPGFVVTVEPGLYFIPELIDHWKAGRKHSEFINYDVVEEYRDFGGVRVEDDVLVTEDGCRVLGKRIPNTIDEVEALASA